MIESRLEKSPGPFDALPEAAVGRAEGDPAACRQGRR